MTAPTRAGRAVAVMMLAAFGCGDVPPPVETSPVTIRIATGLPGMTFRPLGEALVVAFKEVLPGVHFTTVETEGSVRNVEFVETGQAELGLALADVAYMGFSGRVGELGARAARVRGLAVLHPSTIHVLVSPNSTIGSLSDLKGRRVGVGPPGSGTAVTSSLLLRAHGVSADQVEQHVMPFLGAIEALTRGELDAVLITAAAPVEVVQQATRAGARLLDVAGPVAERLRVEYPFLQPTTIPPGTYPGQTTPVHTLRESVILICRQDLDDVIVRDITAALFKVLPGLTVRGDFLRLVDVRRAPATPIPLHPGAAWYYRERELSR
jgi:TRAP transporter TAXI family solute receptor